MKCRGEPCSPDCRRRRQVTHISQKSVPKSRFLTASPSREKPWVVISTVSRIMEVRWTWDKRLLPQWGRSCHPLALRNQWVTDVGGRRRRHRILPEQNPRTTAGRPYGSVLTRIKARKHLLPGFWYVRNYSSQLCQTFCTSSSSSMISMSFSMSLTCSSDSSFW